MNVLMYACLTGQYNWTIPESWLEETIIHINKQNNGDI